MRIFCAIGRLTVLGVLISSAQAGAGTVYVNPNGTEQYTTIQAAIDNLPNPGPHTVIVRAGTYAESLAITSKNTRANSEAERIVICADPAAPFGSVVIRTGYSANEGKPRGGSATHNSIVVRSSKFLTVKGFGITGAQKSGVVLRGGNNANASITLENNDVYETGLGPGDHAGIQVEAGNTSTWIINNLIRHNGRNGFWDATDSSNPAWSPIYVVNNTFFANGWNGASVTPGNPMFFVNNLFVGNGVAPDPPVAAGQRWGLKVADGGSNGTTAASIKLLDNMFFKNGMFARGEPGNSPVKGGDISSVARIFDSTDSDNWTTIGTEGPDAEGMSPATGIAGATPAASVQNIFKDPGALDFHLADNSPAIDAGINSLMLAGREWVPVYDFEADARPANGDGQGEPIVDIGHDEAVPPLLVTAVALPTGGPVPLAVVLDAIIVGNAVSFAWDFDGDGVDDYTSSFSPRTSRTYRNVGVFNATVRITDAFGRTATSSVVVTTEPGLQAMAQANPTSGPRPLRVTFTPRGESTGPPILWYSWDYNGDGIYDSGQLPRPDPTTYTYNAAGTYNATLRIQDAVGTTATDSVQIDVFNVPPTAVASVSPTNGPAPLMVNFNGSATTTNGSIVSYQWDFDGDGTFDYTSATTGNATFTFTTAGTRQPVFRVTDSIGLQTTLNNFQIEVRVGAPSAPTAVATVSPTQGNAPLNVTLGCTGSNDPGGSLALYEWDFDYDGAFSPDYSSPSTCNTMHTYTTGGTHYVALRVTDNSGLTGVDVKSVLVNVVVTLAVLDDTFNPHAAQTTTVRTTSTAELDMRVYIRNWAGATIRTLFQGTRAAGTFDDIWDGRDDDGVIAADADYYAYIDYNVQGLTRTKPDAPSGNLQYAATWSESPTNGAGIAPWNDQFWEMIFRTDLAPSYGASEVELFITPYGVTNVITAQPLTREVFGAGTHREYWEGLTSTGQYVTDTNQDIGDGGDFLWAAFGYTLPDNAMVVEGGRPVVNTPTATPNYVRSPDSPLCVGENGTDIAFNLTREAVVSLRVFSMKNGALVGLVTTELLAVGPQVIHWDAKAVSGEFVEAGNYYVEITGQAADGNISRIRRVLVQVSY